MHPFSGHELDVHPNGKFPKRDTAMKKTLATFAFLSLFLHIPSVICFRSSPAESHSQALALERINSHLNAIYGTNFTFKLSDFPALDQGAKNHSKLESLPTSIPLNLSAISADSIRHLLPADLLMQSIFLSLANWPSAPQDDECCFRPKPISVLMNFGIDGNVEWSASNDDKQDDCREIPSKICVPAGILQGVHASCYHL